MNKPFSQACGNNKEPVLQMPERYFAQAGCVLEIGSGTGQHAGENGLLLLEDVAMPANNQLLVWRKD